MPKKKWIVATAALAVVKGKKLTNKKKSKQTREEKHISGEHSYVSSDGSDSSDSGSGSELLHSDDSDSRSIESIGSSSTSSSRKNHSDDSETTDSSSCGCGTYHRRESLSRSSSSIYSDESSFSSYSSSGSSQLSGSPLVSECAVQQNSTDCPLSHPSLGKDELEPPPLVSHGQDKPSGIYDSESQGELDIWSKTTLKSIVKSMSSKTLGKRDPDADEEPEVLSNLSCKVNSRSTSASNKPLVSLNPSMYDDEQASMMQRRRSTMGGRGRGRTRGDLGHGDSAPESNSDSFIADGGSVQRPPVLGSEKMVEKLEMAQDDINEMMHKARGQRMDIEKGLTDDDGVDKGNPEDKFNALLKTVRNQNPTNMAGFRKTADTDGFSQAKVCTTCTAEGEPVTSDQSSKSPDNRDSGGELSYSLKTELLANANSNLRSSVTSIASEQSGDSLNDDASRKSVGSSRFASMMANLKSSNEANISDELKPTVISRTDNHSGSDDDHIFEAPKIVNERGQSMRSLLNNETSLGSAHADDAELMKFGNVHDDDEGHRSRFTVRRNSFRELISGHNDPPLDTGASEQNGKDTMNHLCATESLREYQSDEDSKLSDASISTASSGDDENLSPVSNLARMRYPEDDDNSSEDDLDYYGEPAMTILTPITEMGSMESDAETASHGSDASETDSDNDTEPITCQSELDTVKSFPKKLKSTTTSSNLFHVIKSVRANDPELKLVQLDGSGLNDFDAAKLLYLLHNNSYVTHISLANNNLSDGSAVSLAQVLIGSETIKSVCLSGNKIGNKGALALKKALKVNEKLIHLDLNENDIDSYVMEGLQESFSVILPSCHFQADESIENPIGSAHILEEALHPHKPSVAEDGSMSDGSSHDNSSNFSHKCAQEGEGVVVMELGKQIEAEEMIHSNDSSAVSPGSITSENCCSLLKIYDKSCLRTSEMSQHFFQTSLSTMQKTGSETASDMSILLSMSLALNSLDCGWLVEAATKVVDGRHLRAHHRLGDRERLFPWKNFYATEKPPFLTKEDDPSIVAGARRKASRSLQRMTSSRWKDSMSKASSLRRSLLSLSEQNVNERKNNRHKPCSDIGTEQAHLHSCHVQKRQQWASSFKKLDPRWQIRKFFNDMSVFGTVLSDVTQSDHLSEGAAIFSVWRPTSSDAIAKMMRGDGVGKGLEIKGKSAKTGILSGYIPFLQIHHKEHKKQIRTIPKGDRTKIFFKSHHLRDMVGEYLGTVAKELTLHVAQAKVALARAKFGCDPNVILREELNYAAKMLSYELENPKVVQNDDYAPDMYCIEVSCRVLWEGLVERKDISRTPGSKLDTGRASQPAFQDMNFAALRRRHSSEPLPVLYQNSEEDPFDARMLVMAYEEEGKVVPVVSDFDCFLIGSRNFSYEDPMSVEQVELLNWCVSQIEWILENHTGPECWTTRWLEVLKYAARNGFYPSMPRFGFGDPTSYSMIEASVHRSAQTCGAVRHGPECFNFFFPQELDDEFLIIFPGNEMWKYVNEKELLCILREKIQEGFTFPLNPKWLLCDPGWISLFQDLLDSHHSSVQNSIDLWFPPESGLRERILDINLRYPAGFLRDDQTRVSPSLAQEEYERYLILQRARRKLRGFIYWRNLLHDVRQRATSSIDDNCLGTVKEF